MDLSLSDCFVAVESRDALERRDLRLWRRPSFVFGSRRHTLETVSSHGSPGGRLRTESPSRKRASIPHPERMVRAAPAFGVSPSEKRTLDLVTDHPMIPREHLARWLGVSEGRVSQTMHSLVDAWGLVERHGGRGETRYTLSAEGIRYVTHRDRAQLPTTLGVWSTALTTDRQGRRRHVGHRIDTWARQTKHADGDHLVPLRSWMRKPGPRRPASCCGRSPPPGPTAAFNWGESAIAPDAVGKVVAAGLHVPFYLEYELRARHPRGVAGSPEPLHALLLVRRARRRPTPVPHHTVRRGQRGRRGNLRAHNVPDELDVPARPRVLPACAVRHRGAGEVMAAALGAGVPRDRRCPSWVPTDGTRSATGCVL